ncbi:MAG: PASTA domain-containing protein, partial [Terriglobales bacterium]
MKRLLRWMLLGLVLVVVAMVSALTAMRLAIHGREAEVPKLTGMEPAQARKALEPLGLALEVENRFYNSEIAPGRIVSQLPQPGTRVRSGWRVRVALSLGAQRALIPSLVGQSPRAAEIDVHRRGLDLGSTSVVHIPDLPGDQVIGQSPPARA